MRLVFVFALLFERTSDHQLRLALHVFALSVLLCLLCRRCLRCLLCSAWQDVDETSSPIRISATLPPDAITITTTSPTRAGSLALWLSLQLLHDSSERAAPLQVRPSTARRLQTAEPKPQGRNTTTTRSLPFCRTAPHRTAGREQWPRRLPSSPPSRSTRCPAC